MGCGFKATINLDYQDYPGEVKFRDQRIACFAGIGTHMDAPSHCIPGGLSIADIPVEKFIQACVVINVAKKAHADYQISLDDVKAFESQYGLIPKNAFVIFYTGWSQYWQDPERYRNNLHFPSVSVEAAQFLL